MSDTAKSVKIDKSSVISIGLVLAMLAVAGSFGATYQKVSDLDRRVASVEKKIDILIQIKFTLKD